MPIMTVFARFTAEFPDRVETKVLLLLDRTTLKEKRRIYLDERFCADPDCDCQIVMLCPANGEGEELGAIMYDFLGRTERAPGGLNPYLEPGVEQPEGAEEILGHVRREIEKNPAYVERLRRHYEELRNKIRTDPAHRLWPAILEDRRQMELFGEGLAHLFRARHVLAPMRVLSRQERNRAKRERKRR